MNLPLKIIQEINKEERNKNYTKVFSVIPLERKETPYIPNYFIVNGILESRRVRKFSFKLIERIWKKKTAKCIEKVTPVLPYKESYKIPLFFNPFHTKERRIKKCIAFFDNKMSNLNYNN